MYRVEAQSPPVLLDAYDKRNRRVWAQELDLEPARKARLLQILQTDVLPENHIYRYDYYRNNCSTKLRDALDTVWTGSCGRPPPGLQPARPGGRTPGV